MLYFFDKVAEFQVLESADKRVVLFHKVAEFQVLESAVNVLYFFDKVAEFQVLESADGDEPVVAGGGRCCMHSQNMRCALSNNDFFLLELPNDLNLLSAHPEPFAEPFCRQQCEAL